MSTPAGLRRARSRRAAGWPADAGEALHRGARDRWMVSWADFTTLLFALFVVLFAASRSHRNVLGQLAGAIHAGFHTAPAASATIKPPPAAPQVPPGPPGVDFAALEQQLRTVLGPAVAQGQVALLQTPEGLVVSFREFGFFRSGAADLVPGQAAKVVEAGRMLAVSGLSLRIEGHSDDRPIRNRTFRSNWELSTARAMTVLLLLVDGAQYDPTRVSLAGYGPYRPVADNSTEAGRQQNRRVDVVVLRPHSGM